jgi:anti-sigma factor ChrR (cupin superfamily)
MNIGLAMAAELASALNKQVTQIREEVERVIKERDEARAELATLKAAQESEPVRHSGLDHIVELPERSPLREELARLKAELAALKAEPSVPVSKLRELALGWRKFSGEARRCGQHDAADTAVLDAEAVETLIAAAEGER